MDGLHTAGDSRRESTVGGARAKVAVVITCYSGQKYFEEAALSVAAQTEPGIQLIFHDNGCSPAYRALMRSVGERTGGTIIHTEVNRYGEGLRYDVLPRLTSEYVAILHDDDFYEKTKIAEGMAFMRAHRLDYLFTERRHVDAEGRPFEEDYEEVNTRPFTLAEFPDQHIADTFYRGLRLHFSTLIMKAELAQKNLMGDPYLPRITDSLYMQRLLLDETIKGAAVPGKLTNVRVHGENDMLYSKFSEQARAKEFGLLQFSEYFIFQELIRTATTERLAKVFAIFPGIPIIRGEDRVSLLVRASLDLRNWNSSKPLMGAYCVHEAWRIDPLRTLDKVRELSPEVGGGPFVDANKLMTGLYRQYIDNVAGLLCPPWTADEVRSARAEVAGLRARFDELVEDAQRHRDQAEARQGELERELALTRSAYEAVTTSTSWKATGPLRALVGRAKGVTPAAAARVQVPGPDRIGAGSKGTHLSTALRAVRSGRPIDRDSLAALRISARSTSDRSAFEAAALNQLVREADLTMDREPEIASAGAVLADFLALCRVPESAPSELLISPLLSIQTVTLDGRSGLHRPGVRADKHYRTWRVPGAAFPHDALLRIELPGLDDISTGPDAMDLSDFYLLERATEDVVFRWTGPAETARAVVPVVVRTPATIDLLLTNYGVGPFEALRMTVNGWTPRLAFDRVGELWRVSAQLDPQALQPGLLDIELTAPQTNQPGGGDPRSLGIAVASLVLTMDPPSR